MKKILLGLMIAGITIATANEVKFFKKTPDSTGGVMNKEVIYIYRDAKAGKNQGEDSRVVLLSMAKKKICESKGSRDLIEKDKMSVKFIYLSSEGATIVNVDSCKGVKVK